MWRRVWLLMLVAGCATPPPTDPSGCLQTVRVRDGDGFGVVAARQPPAGRMCLAYHRARAKLIWAETPRESAPVLVINTSAIEIFENNRLVGAWYGPCQGEPPLRQTIAPEATHYMVRFLALRRPPSVQIRVGRDVSAVDLMFALETMNDFGHELYVDPRPITDHPSCERQAVTEVAIDQGPAPEAIDDALLAAVVAPRLPLIQSCFRRTIRPLPCSSLVRRVDLGIDPRGRVVDAAVADHTYGTPEVDACVDAAIWDLVFPPPGARAGVKGTLKFQNCERLQGAPSLDFDQSTES